MDCLVTGGAGFVGSNLVDALIEQGDRVAVLDDMSTGKHQNLAEALERGAALHAADVRDPAAVAAVFEVTRPEVVFHLAAQIDVRHSVENPVEDAVTNVLGMIRVLQAAHAVGTRRLVYSSTGGALYGDTDVLPTPEDHPIRPLAPYGTSKYGAECYADMFSRLNGLSAVSLRYSNVYGPRQDVHGEAGVVAIFCGALVEGRRPTVYGDGRQTRDWIEVSDVVRANLLAADSDVVGPINIASGEETSVLDLIEALDEVSERGHLTEPQFAPARPGEARRSCLDPSRARRELGWEAKVGLCEGLRRILEKL